MSKLTGLALAALAALWICGPSQAALITTDHIVQERLTLELPDDWSIYEGRPGIDSLLDGNATNGVDATHLTFAPNNGNALTSDNPIKISFSLKDAWEITSFELANDWRNYSNSEVMSMDVLFLGNSGILQKVSASGLNNQYDSDRKNTDTLDSIFLGSVAGVTGLEIFITGAETGDQGTEIREFIIKGNPSPVPVPGTILLLGSGLMGLAAFRRR